MVGANKQADGGGRSHGKEGRERGGRKIRGETKELKGAWALKSCTTRGQAGFVGGQRQCSHLSDESYMKVGGRQECKTTQHLHGYEVKQDGKNGNNNSTRFEVGMCRVEAK